ncbi:hypothetical protein ACN28S_12620 [Cystobacter fuscus]
MSAFSGQKLDKIPAHVPPELVYEYDNARDPRLLEDPHARMRSLILEAPPIFFTPYNGGNWVVTRKKAIVDITMNPAVYSNAFILGGAKEDKGEHKDSQPGLTMLPIAADPPRHTAYRAPLNQPLSAKSVAGLETAIRDMTNELIDKVLGAGRCDFLSDIAEPLPVTLFMKLAGMPTDRLAEFRHRPCRRRPPRWITRPAKGSSNKSRGSWRRASRPGRKSARMICSAICSTRTSTVATPRSTRCWATASRCSSGDWRPW